MGKPWRKPTRWGVRGCEKFDYTYEDIAYYTGLSLNTVRTYAYQGRFCIRDLRSVVLFMHPYLVKG